MRIISNQKPVKGTLYQATQSTVYNYNMKTLLIISLLLFCTLQQILDSTVFHGPAGPLGPGTYPPVKDPAPTPIKVRSHDEIVRERNTTDSSGTTTLGYSGDGQSVRLVNKSDTRSAGSFLSSVLPSARRLQFAPSNPLPKQIYQNMIANPFPWLPQAQAVTPGPSPQIFNIGIIVVYELYFSTSCLNNPVTLHIHVWDNFIISDPVTGQQLYPATPGTWASPVCNGLYLPVKCGCTKLYLTLYNWQQPSYYLFWFQLYQSEYNCYNCPANPIDSFYNRDNCKCECAYQANNCGSYNKVWVGYPTCGCQCQYQQYCPSPRYWDVKTCSCKCKPICCLPGTYLNQATCSCY